MDRVRHLIRHRPAFVAALLLATLLLRLLVPAGFMPAAEGGRLTLMLCSGMAAPAPGGVVPVDMAMAAMHPAMAAMHHNQAADKGGNDHPKAEQPCAFAGLGLPALGTADPLLLAAAIAFAFLLVVRRRAPRVAPVRPRLRPPLRAPPATV